MQMPTNAQSVLQVDSRHCASLQTRRSHGPNLYAPCANHRWCICHDICDRNTFSELSSRMYRGEFKIAKSFRDNNSCPVPQCAFRMARIDKNLKRGHRLSVDEGRVYCKIARARSSSKRKDAVDRERVSIM